MTKTVALFGSSRPNASRPIYARTQRAAKLLAENGWTIATGGGPGLMEAANKGAVEGCEGSVCSLGYSIYLPFEAKTNDAVQEDTHHQDFFTRLQQFSNDCDAFIALPGGWGTLLEILVVVQLLQVGHMKKKPLILVGGDWLIMMERAEMLLKQSGYVGIDEGPYWTIAKNPEEAAKMLLEMEAQDDQTS